MSSMNALETMTMAKGCLRGMKCANLVNLSTTTKIQLKWPEVGNPSTKSNVTIDQDDSSIGSG